MIQKYALLLWAISCLCSSVMAQQTHSPASTSEGEMEKTAILLPGQDIDKLIKENIFIRVETSKKTCFVGEPLLVTYKLCTRLQSKSKVIDPPTFKGCSVIEMTTNNLNEQEEKINGKPFKAYIIRKVQVIPLQEGLLDLGKTTVANNLQFYNVSNGGYSPFTKDIQIVNDSTSITVYPLPTDSQDHVFSGAIGKFFMNVKVLKTNDTANDNNSLEITIAGNGNFMNMVCPKINWPSNIQAFEPQASELLDKLSFPTLGEKKFIIPFNCKKTGEAVIPAINFRYFDADAKEYASAESDTIHIKVLPAVPLLDKTKVSNEISNLSYIWIVPTIGAIVGLVFLFSSLKKKKKPIKKETPTQVMETKPTALQHETVEEFQKKINTPSSVDDKNQFYTEAKQIAMDALKTNIHLTEKNKADLEQVILWCNEAMYASVDTSKEAIILALESIVG